MTFDLSSLGWDANLAGAYAGYSGPNRRPARVARADRGACTVLGAAGALRATLAGSVLLAAARDPGMLPCTGDWIVAHTWPDRRVTVESILPRRTAVVGATADPAAHGRVLAANIDVAAVVEPLDPQPDTGRVGRLLALARRSGARPILVLTKADRVACPAAIAARLAEAAPDVPVHWVSAHTGDGLADLRHLGHGRTLGLLGVSGAGKSSLVDALAGTTVLTTQARGADGRGRHTGAVRTLVPLPGGGVLLDTPGIRAAAGAADPDGLDGPGGDGQTGQAPWLAVLAGRSTPGRVKKSVRPRG